MKEAFLIETNIEEMLVSFGKKSGANGAALRPPCYKRREAQRLMRPTHGLLLNAKDGTEINHCNNWIGNLRSIGNSLNKALS